MFSKHLNLNFNCMLCDAELKLNERFHKTYTSHIVTSHSDLPEEEYQEVMQKIKKMRIDDVSDELPEVLRQKELRNNECSVCNVNFSTAADLTHHKRNAHDIGNTE